ncbi:adenosine 5'-monophosphoramidase [Ascoidea rubescens DSM 1968]|uniref:HIT-like protein n=1 Tax=Ascoidea rubescens DSM 1968 TaxID=1344418 RepID=A0A1D2VPZ5_9ASCO|nr:HIT-like protein [Ascoidea rubescens DSM 1968]ODV63703.1 HIT-like protein [Ascoidea rubescens DSM 1968]
MSCISSAACIFCKIIKGEIPSFKLIETKYAYSFLDIEPCSKGHALVIPKYHGAKLHNLPDEYLHDVLPILKKLAIALEYNIDSPEGKSYNILQNNGRLGHQVVDHVHFHLIPKNTEKDGLIVGWPAEKANFDDLSLLHKELLKKLED